jgi:hypothetical protein
MPGEYYLGSAVVAEKTNEIFVARELFKHLELEDRLVGSVATLQLPRDRLAGCFSWPLRFAVYLNGVNLNRR